MIPVDEARQIIKDNCPEPRVTEMPLSDAAGAVLAVSVYSPIDSPPFHQSAMDGYAFSFSKWDKKNKLTLSGEIQAGNSMEKEVQAFEAIRIFTGAPVPLGADTVVMQEKVIREGNEISILDESLFIGMNVRPRGSQTKSGELALMKNQILSPAAVAFLAGIGIKNVQVYSKPRVNIIITGNELLSSGQERSGGQIYESNSLGLAAALKQLEIIPEMITTVRDEEKALIDAITANLSTDILILTGGVSVGEYDLVPSALEKCGVNKLFHKIKQKPGKPIYFGKHDNTLVFALPGNPAAVMTCFYEYITPAISSYSRKEYLKTRNMQLDGEYTKKPGLTYFLKGKTTDKGVQLLDHQESYLLNSFAIADCIVELEEGQTIYRKDDMVRVRMII